MGSSADLGYHIVYVSHIGRSLMDGFIEITGVQAQENCANGHPCDNSGVDPQIIR